MWATQFHPEKSSRTGLAALRAFVDRAAAALMDLYPAIDLRGGKVVQLTQGDFDRERIHGDDPVAVAQGFVAGGRRWIHTVDLDAARTGEPVNRHLIAAIAAAVDVPVQAGGGSAHARCRRGTGRRWAWPAW